MKTFKRPVVVAAALAGVFALSACGGQSTVANTEDGGMSGSVTTDGSSTVAPLTEAAADLFREVEPGVNVSVATSGTGGGFKTFCAGETDISNASREIKDEEAQACADAGTFDYFTDAVNGEEGAIRTDYSPSEDDNITVQGVSGDVGAMGFLGLSYVEENADVIKAVAVDGVMPSTETVQDGSYTPLGRPLFIYVNNASYLEKVQVASFVDFYVANAAAVSERALFVPLTADQITLAADELASLG